MRSCQYCNSPLTGRRQFKFCSLICGSKFSNETKKRQPKQCKCCNNKFLPKTRMQIYCTRSCAISINTKGQQRNGIPRIPFKPCLNCEELTNKKFFCSRLCASASRRKYPNLDQGKSFRARHNEAWHRYMAKRKDQTPIDVDIDKLQQFYMNCPEGHEVDHIIPISRGGLHSPENLQYLPMIENRRKGAKLLIRLP